ncbi:MAG: type II secretion system protein [Microcoleus sp. SIO2G3]|nr:type II secretion system protein [Microcoleus sp. SIO2G3]
MATSSSWQRLVASWLSRDGRPAMPQGITLVECLMAITVIAITTAMITPPLFIAAATRLQNQRAEQAMQIAQGEVDRVRFLVERQRHTPARLPAVVTAVPIGNAGAPSGATGLSASIQSKATCPNAYNGQPLAATQALQVDDTGDCQADFAVQMFRTEGQTFASERSLAAGDGRLNRPSNFCLVVRVYGKPAINTLNSGGALDTKPASIRFTNGEGNSRTQPLAVITTPMIWGDRSFSSGQLQASGGNICR